MRTQILFMAALALAAGCGAPNTDAPLTISRLFSDGAVLQRNTPVPVWGTGDPASRITILFNDSSQRIRVGAEGNWTATLDPHEAGGPHTLSVSSEDDTLTVEYIWFGDVWVASGQSNMAWTVKQSADAENEINSADDPLLRHFKVPLSWSYQPEHTLAGGQWQSAQPDVVGSFSAVAYSFARDLRTSLDIPIGIVNTSWGGSRIEAWMTPEALMANDTNAEEILAARQRRADSLHRHFMETYHATDSLDAGMPDSVALWKDPELNLELWTDIPVPGTWESAGLTDLNGFVWYRRTFEVSEADAGADAVLHLGTIDDRDMTWINGHLVGATNGVRQVRTYDVPTGILQPGVNTVAVRVHDTGGQGGMVTDEGGLELRTRSGSVALSGTWKLRVGQFVIDPGGGPNQQPTLLYNKMLHPMLSFPVTGFIWYQGESNGGNPDDAARYADQFKTMITTWRTLFSNEQAPFLFVSLASFRAAPDEPGDSNWAILRESQAAALELDKVGQAITLDIGEADDIHPRNKQDVGLRLALAARHLQYGEDLVYSGPTYRDHAVDGNRIVITFNHVGSGLASRTPALGGFAVAGSDGVYVWAEARIEDNAVIVSHPSIETPTDVRYAWADNPDTASLINQEGLPAAPFQTGR
ncbi:MAG: 9-O-acetylesterase [Bacteroidota bacterium]|nr:9-O-acetylesterase [Bacteroidota bacterium]MDE2835441.1 9-O-acetylesterase [Bacteroidota bacterium]